jgi:hypothetical protein
MEMGVPLAFVNVAVIEKSDPTQHDVTGSDIVISSSRIGTAARHESRFRI